MSNVADILYKKGLQFNTLDAATNVISAISVMKSEDESYIIVTQNEHYVGLFSESNYTQGVVVMGKEPHKTNIDQVMTANLPYISPNGTLEQSMILMNSHKTSYLPVFNNFKFIGVITMQDLIEEMIENAFKAEC